MYFTATCGYSTYSQVRDFIATISRYRNNDSNNMLRNLLRREDIVYTLSILSGIIEHVKTREDIPKYLTDSLDGVSELIQSIQFHIEMIENRRLNYSAKWISYIRELDISDEIKHIENDMNLLHSRVKLLELTINLTK